MSFQDGSWRKVITFSTGFAPKLTTEINKVIETDVKKLSSEQHRAAPVKTGKMQRETYATSTKANSYSAVSDAYYSIFVNFGTYRMPPRAFFTAPIEKYEDIIVNDVNAVFAKTIKGFFI